MQGKKEYNKISTSTHKSYFQLYHMHFYIVNLISGCVLDPNSQRYYFLVPIGFLLALTYACKFPYFLFWNKVSFESLKEKECSLRCI